MRKKFVLLLAAAIALAWYVRSRGGLQSVFESDADYVLRLYREEVGRSAVNMPAADSGDVKGWVQYIRTDGRVKTRDQVRSAPESVSFRMRSGRV